MSADIDRAREEFKARNQTAVMEASTLPIRANEMEVS